MFLAEILNHDDENAIQSIIQRPEYKTLSEPFWWIGANDLGKENEFYWVNSGENVRYSNWAAGQPDNAGQEHCGEIRGHYQYMWNDHQCDQRKYFVCEVMTFNIDIKMQPINLNNDTFIMN